MISIIKYLSEMLDDDESHTGPLDNKYRKEMGPEYDRRLQMMKKAKTGEANPTNTGIGKKIIKKVIPTQQEGTEPGTIIKPIKKIIDATQQ